MRRYNIHITIPNSGRYELIKENSFPQGIHNEDYWEECFTWEDMKKIIPYLKSRGWKVNIEPVEKEEIFDKIHLFSITYGINHDFQVLNISGLRVIMSRDFGKPLAHKKTYNPFGY